MTTQAELREKLALILQRYAHVPPKDAKFLIADVEELTSYATEVELLADATGNGNVAYAVDTGKFYFRREGAWEASPNPDGGGGVTQYATEALLVAATPADGTIGYAQDTDAYWYRRGSAWEATSNAVSTVGTHQTSALSFPVDYAAGTDPVPGVVFRSQADITAYLTAHSITHFKHVMACWDSLPDNLYQAVTFALVPGVHRPRVADPTGKPWAFIAQPNKKAPVFHFGSSLTVGAANNLDPAAWTELVTPQVCTAASTTTGGNGLEVFLDFAGTPFTAGALKGYFAQIQTATATHYVIRDNTASRLYLSATYSSNPVGQNVRVVKPATILRNSLDDLVAAYVQPLIHLGDERMTSRFGGTVVFDTLSFEQYTNQLVFYCRGQQPVSMSQCLIDAAALKNAGITTATIFQSTGGVYASFFKSSIRGMRLATVPASGTTLCSVNGANPKNEASYMGFSNTYLGGSSSTSRIENSIFYLAGTMVEDCLSDVFTLENVGLAMQASGPRPMFRTCPGIPLRLNRYVTHVQGYSGFNFDLTMVFDNCLGGTMFWMGDFCSVWVVDMRNGAQANTSVPFLFNGAGNTVIGYRPGLLASGDAVRDFSGGGGLDQFFKFADMAKWREVIPNPNTAAPYSSIPGIYVKDVCDLDPTLTDNAQLDYTAAGTLLKWYAPGEVAYGASVNISAGGWFTIYGATTSKWLLVFVVPGLLPGVNYAAHPMKIKRRPFHDRARNNLFAVNS